MAAQPKTSDLDLRNYLQVLSRRKWIIVGITLLAATTAFVLSSRQTPRYRATSELLFKPGSSDLLAQNSTGFNLNPQRALATEIKILRSAAVRPGVVSKIGSAPPVKVVSSEEENVISVTAESTSPREAAAVANAYALAYIDHRRASTLDESLAAQKANQTKIDEAQTQIDEKTREIDEKRRQSPNASSDLTSGLETERQQLLSQQGSFRAQLGQLQLRADLAGGVELVTEATPPSEPFAPTPERATLFAGSLGLLVGFGLAFLVDFFDDSITTTEDLERAAPGVPLLGMVPVAPTWKSRNARIVSIEESASSYAESYRALRTSLQFVALDRMLKLLQVTSPLTGEGKSSTVSNLGVAFARASVRAAIVDCDLRRPRIHEYFGIRNETGFTSVLLGNSPLTSAMRETEGLPLQLLTAGPLPPNPSELLSTHRASDILSTVVHDNGGADIAIVDSPPALLVSDAAVLSKLVDGTILVVMAGRTTRRQLHRTVELLRGLEANLLGIVLNGVDERSPGYGYGDPYGYRERLDRAGRKLRRAAAREGEVLTLADVAATNGERLTPGEDGIGSNRADGRGGDARDRWRRNRSRR